MNCNMFKRLIQPYLRSEVDRVFGNEFRWHKHFCDGCRKAFAAAQSSLSQASWNGRLQGTDGPSENLPSSNQNVGRQTVSEERGE
jgi:hypothetical protein